MSVQTYIKGKGWLVAGHVTDAIVAKVSFKVSEPGRQRVIRDRRKNVHAWGEGVLIGQSDTEIDCPIDLAYDPYRNETFVERSTQRPIRRADFLIVRNNCVFVSSDALPTVVPSESYGNIISLIQTIRGQSLLLAA